MLIGWQTSLVVGWQDYLWNNWVFHWGHPTSLPPFGMILLRKWEGNWWVGRKCIYQRVWVSHRLKALCPTFLRISCLYSLFLWVANRLEKLQRDFVWGSLNEEPKFHLAKSAQICSPKQGGGLGIWNLCIFNLALLDKWLWQYATEREHIRGWLLRSSTGAWTVGVPKWWRVPMEFGCRNIFGEGEMFSQNLLVSG